jgi:hypothetical protein
MRVLLDTNIIIHREALTVVRDDIGTLFWWLDKLYYTKCIHPITISELEKYKDAKILKSIKAKIGNYTPLHTIAPVTPKIQGILDSLDQTDNDKHDTLILNELFSNRVDILITEDKGIIKKACLLDISDKVYLIDSFLEKVVAENPGLTDYKVLAVKLEHFGNINLADPFFDSFKEDYPGFEKWFNKKADEQAYVCRMGNNIQAFLYLKIEEPGENYSDIEPTFTPMRRLKIGTFKVVVNGYRLGERFLKIVFDNAIRNKVTEIYVTIFDKGSDRTRLIELMKDVGFRLFGIKHSMGGKEQVYVRNFTRNADRACPSLTFPYISRSAPVFLAAIWPAYHTELFPDSILRTESINDFTDNQPHRNAIRKIFISRAYERGLNSGDILIFYRTGGYYQSVVTTVGIVEQVLDNIHGEAEFVKMCRKRSVFSDEELKKWWNYKPSMKPFIVEFLYAYSFPIRINMKKLMELGVIPNITGAPRGFTRITPKNVQDIFAECEVDASIIAD